MEKKVTLLQVYGDNTFSVDFTFMSDDDWSTMVNAYYAKLPFFVKILDTEIYCYIVEIEVKH